jgi:4-amino-4-deoxy-L-arabinose transferase-like glycosyltransferase
LRQRLCSLVAAASALFFLLAGQPFIPLLGIEDDESLFAAPLLNPHAWHWAIKSGHLRIPIMVMSYIGTLKTLLYTVVFRLARPGVWSAREPMLVAGAASIWIFYLLLRRTAGPRAAAFGAALLATDACYLLTTVFDWGPVALQHLLLTAALYLLVRFAQERSHRALAAGFFLLGLAMWDKALAVWMISGMAVAAAVVFWRPIAALLTRRRVAIAGLWFVLGASPLLVFNAKRHWSTFQGNVKRDTGAGVLEGKARMLMNTVNGQGLFGYLTDEDWQTPRPHPVSTALADAVDHPRHSLMFYAALLALALAPFAGWAAFRTVAFCSIALAVAWIQMALTANTGGSVHHTILLWPLPVWMVAVSFAGAAERLGRAAAPVLAVLAVLLVGSNLLVMNEYHVMMARNGGSVSWSDAIFPLTQRLRETHPPAVFCVDWGIQDSLRLLGRGALTTYDLTGPPDSPAVLADPAFLFVGRPKELEVFQGNGARLAAAAAAAGYRRDRVAEISDSFGRPTFDVYRFAK